MWQDQGAHTTNCRPFSTRRRSIGHVALTKRCGFILSDEDQSDYAKDRRCSSPAFLQVFLSLEPHPLRNHIFYICIIWYYLILFALHCERFRARRTTGRSSWRSQVVSKADPGPGGFAGWKMPEEDGGMIWSEKYNYFILFMIYNVV